FRRSPNPAHRLARAADNRECPRNVQDSGSRDRRVLGAPPLPQCLHLPQPETRGRRLVHEGAMVGTATDTAPPFGGPPRRRRRGGRPLPRLATLGLGAGSEAFGW